MTAPTWTALVARLWAVIVQRFARRVPDCIDCGFPIERVGRKLWGDGAGRCLECGTVRAAADRLQLEIEKRDLEIKRAMRMIELPTHRTRDVAFLRRVDERFRETQAEAARSEQDRLARRADEIVEAVRLTAAALNVPQNLAEQCVAGAILARPEAERASVTAADAMSIVASLHDRLRIKSMRRA